VFDLAAIRAQSRMTELQGRKHTWYCGAWTRYGFHEDGLSSGLAVAQSIGCEDPLAAPAVRANAASAPVLEAAQ